jgi:hypothetical protein
MFRQMLHRLTLFWALGAIVIAAITTAIIFTIEKDVAYIVSIMKPMLSPSSLIWIAWLVHPIHLGRRLGRYHREVGPKEPS